MLTDNHSWSRIFKFGIVLALVISSQSRAEEFKDIDLKAAAQRSDIALIEAKLPSITDPYFSQLARLEIAASRLDENAVHRELRAYLNLNDKDTRRNAEAWSLAANSAFAAGKYDEAARASSHWLWWLRRDDPEHEINDAEQTQKIAALLAEVPAMDDLGGAGRSVRTQRDKVGLTRAVVSINGLPESAVLDTGANLSVVSMSEAKRLNLRIIDGGGTVSSGTRDAVPVRIGLARTLEVAGRHFKNVPFLVFDDQQLTMPVPGGYSIGAIIGFPIFKSFGAIILGNDHFAPASRLPEKGSARISARGNDLFLHLSLAGLPVPLQIDSGSSQSSLSAAFAKTHRALINNLSITQQKSASAGGTTVHRVAHWKNVTVAVGSTLVPLPDLTVQVAESSDVRSNTYGTLGQDLLHLFHSYTIDLKSMRFKINDEVRNDKG